MRETQGNNEGTPTLFTDLTKEQNNITEQTNSYFTLV